MFGQHSDFSSGTTSDDNTSRSQSENGGLNSQIPSAPSVNESSNSFIVGAPVSQPSQDDPAAASPKESARGKDDLLDIKQKALHDLSPLVKHLDQSPVDKFKTTMMMIQASDDQSLLPAAYEAAHKITDEKEKAQALLDVVNEINYFTNKDAA